MLISRTSSQRIELATKFLKSMRDSNIFCLILDENLLKKSYKEQIDLIDKYIELGKDTNVYSIIINSSEKTVTIILIEIKQYLEIGIIRQQKPKMLYLPKMNV